MKEEEKLLELYDYTKTNNNPFQSTCMIAQQQRLQKQKRTQSALPSTSNNDQKASHPQQQNSLNSSMPNSMQMSPVNQNINQSNPNSNPNNPLNRLKSVNENMRPMNPQMKAINPNYYPNQNTMNPNANTNPSTMNPNLKTMNPNLKVMNLNMGTMNPNLRVMNPNMNKTNNNPNIGIGPMRNNPGNMNKHTMRLNPSPNQRYNQSNMTLCPKTNKIGMSKNHAVNKSMMSINPYNRPQMNPNPNQHFNNHPNSMNSMIKAHYSKPKPTNIRFPAPNSNIPQFDQQMNSRFVQMESKMKELEKKTVLVEAFNDILLKMVDTPTGQAKVVLPPINHLSQRQKKPKAIRTKFVSSSLAYEASGEEQDHSITKDVEIELLNNEISYLKNLFTRRLINIEKKQELQDDVNRFMPMLSRNKNAEERKKVRYAYNNDTKEEVDYDML